MYTHTHTHTHTHTGSRKLKFLQSRCGRVLVEPCPQRMLPLPPSPPPPPPQSVTSPPRSPPLRMPRWRPRMRLMRERMLTSIRFFVALLLLRLWWGQVGRACLFLPTLPLTTHFTIHFTTRYICSLYAWLWWGQVRRAFLLAPPQPVVACGLIH